MFPKIYSSYVNQARKQVVMTSNPPGSCCVKGVVHTGTAIGEYSKVGDIDVYRVYPKDKKTYKAILL